jgi:hypothetical protein
LELREMALKAGRYIHMAQSKSSASPANPVNSAASSVIPASPAPAAPITAPPQPDEISPRDLELSRGHLDAATGYFTQGDRGRAIDSLGKALALNPKLQREPFAANLIVTLTGRPVSEGVPVLINPQSRADLVLKAGGKPKLKAQAHGKGADTATWTNVLIDLALYAIITTLATLAIFTVGLEGLKDFYEDYSTFTMVDPYGTGTQEEVDWDAVGDISIALLIPISIGVGIVSIISLVIQAAGVHVAATMILGGTGTYVFLLRRYVPFQTIVTLLYGIAGVLMFVLLPNQPEIVTVILFLAIPASVALIYFSSALVADVYAFG